MYMNVANPLSLRRGGAAWTPQKLIDDGFVYAMYDETTTLVTGVGAAATWMDRSGNGLTLVGYPGFTIGSGTRNGLRTTRCTDWAWPHAMSVVHAFPSAIEVWLACADGGYAGDITLDTNFRYGYAASCMLTMRYVGGNYLWVGQEQATMISSSTPPTCAPRARFWRLWRFVSNGASSSLWINGVQIGTGALSGGVHDQLGLMGRWDRMNGMAAITDLLSPADALSFTTYLTEQWGPWNT